MKVLMVHHAAVLPVNQALVRHLAVVPGVSVGLITPDRWRCEFTGGGLEAAPLSGVAHWRLPVWRAGSVPLHAYRAGLWRAARSFSPHVVLGMEEPYSLAGTQCTWLADRLRASLVLYSNQNLLKRYPPPFSLMERRCLERAALLLTASDEVEQVLRAKGRRGPVARLDHALDPSLFHPENGEARAGEEFTVGYFGRLTAAKGVDTLLRAVALLPDEQRPRVLLGGGGEAEADLRRLGEALGIAGRCRWLGAAPHLEMASCYRRVDLCVVPSRTTPTWKEQFGRVIIESLACEVPVAGSSSGHIPALLQETGGGWVFPEGDEVALAELLRQVAQHPEERRRRARQGREAVLARYTWEAVAQSLAEMLFRIVPQNKEREAWAR